MITKISTLEEMKNFAAELAAGARPGDVFALKGNLGAGKTTFSQFFINSLSEKSQAVTSPTFNLIQIYKTKKFDIWHCDFYRLKSDREFENLGIEDAFRSAVTLIEWPEIATHLLPKNTKYIEIQLQPDGTRIISH